MAASDIAAMPEVVTEAIVVIDLVESTLTSNLFGWYAVGRQALRDLRTLIGEIGASQGLRCLKSTGDGYLITFRDPQSAEMAAIRAVESIFDLLDRIARRNSTVSEERALNLRCAVHIGEVDVVADDREGPHRWPSASTTSRAPRCRQRSIRSRPRSSRCAITSCAAKRSR